MNRRLFFMFLTTLAKTPKWELRQVLPQITVVNAFKSSVKKDLSPFPSSTSGVGSLLHGSLGWILSSPLFSAISKSLKLILSSSSAQVQGPFLFKKSSVVSLDVEIEGKEKKSFWWLLSHFTLGHEKPLN